MKLAPDDVFLVANAKFFSYNWIIISSQSLRDSDITIIDLAVCYTSACDKCGLSRVSGIFFIVLPRKWQILHRIVVSLTFPGGQDKSLKFPHFPVYSFIFRQFVFVCFFLLILAFIGPPRKTLTMPQFFFCLWN